MVGTVDVKEDPKTNTVEITLEAQIVDSSNGQVIHSAAVSGAAAGAEGVPIDQIRERAAQDTAQKALPALGIQMVALTTAPPPGAKKGGDKTKKTEAEKKADREAKKKADEAREKAERDAKAKKKADEKARRDGEKGATTSNSSDKHDGSAILVANAAPAPAAAPAAAPANPASGNVPGYGNAAGQPIPYSYAGDVTTLKARHKKGIRVPDWLGIAGFLTGISFLL
jgi:hypothetical protein